MPQLIPCDADLFYDHVNGGWTMSATEQQVPAPRIPLSLEIEFRKVYARKSDVGYLRNISLTGAFLEHRNPEVKGADKVCITFKVAGRVRKINAQIIWSNAAGSGIKFLPGNNRDVQIVDDLMYFVESGREGKRTVLDDIFKQTG
jgi:hypothetical protein